MTTALLHAHRCMLKVFIFIPSLIFLFVTWFFLLQDEPVPVPIPLNTIPDLIVPSHIIVPRCSGESRPDQSSLMMKWHVTCRKGVTRDCNGRDKKIEQSKRVTEILKKHWQKLWLIIITTEALIFCGKQIFYLLRVFKEAWDYGYWGFFMIHVMKRTKRQKVTSLQTKWGLIWLAFKFWETVGVKKCWWGSSRQGHSSQRIRDLSF